MQDELFMRQWNAHYNRLTAGLTPTPAGRVTTGQSSRHDIGRTYDDPVVDEDRPVQIGSRLIAAGLATATLWVTVIAFATTAGTPFLV